MNANEAHLLLGTSLSSSMREVESAFRDAAKRHHPDAGGTAENFIKIHEALKWLRKNHRPIVRRRAKAYESSGLWCALIPREWIESDSIELELFFVKIKKTTRVVVAWGSRLPYYTTSVTLCGKKIRLLIEDGRYPPGVVRERGGLVDQP